MHGDVENVRKTPLKGRLEIVSVTDGPVIAGAHLFRKVLFGLSLDKSLIVSIMRLVRNDDTSGRDSWQGRSAIRRCCGMRS